MNLQLSISKEQAEILEDLLLTADDLTRDDIDTLAPLQEQVSQLIEDNEWDN